MEMNDISNLASLLRENGDKVLNGQSKLSLTAKLLKNINEAFSMIVEEEEARSTSFHASNLKVEVFHEIQFLHDFVQKTIGLKVTSGSVTCDNFQGSLDISRFKNLRYLELRKVPVSFLSGVKSVRHQLQSIVCIRCIQRLQELLLDCGADHTSGSVWSDLKEAVFSYNGMNVLDHSLDYTPLLQILDLSHNRIAHAEALECLPNLKYLNISYNLLEAVPTVHREACRKLQVLVIRNNYIEDLSGLSALENILELDLSCNCLSDHTSLSPLIYLSSLTWLSLDGNPLSFHPQHRIRTVRNLHSSAATAKFLLDHLPLSKSERLAAGSSSAASSIRSFSRDDSSSAGSSTASDKTLLAEKGVECNMKPQSKVIRKRVREAIISEGDDNLEDSFLSSSISTGSIDLSTDHLETKKEIETIRERFGKDNWLHSHAATCVQDVLGLKSAVPSPVKDNKGSSSSSNVSIVKAEVHKTEENTYNSQTENYSTPDVHHNSEISTNGIAIKTPDSEKRDEEVNEEPAKEESIKESSPESVGMESPEEEEDEGDEELYLVQRLRPGMRKSDEYFLVVNDSWLREREVLCGKTLEKWSMETLQSCVRTGGDAPNALVQLTFDTIRPHRQERLYLMDEKDAQKLVRFLTEILESRPLNQLAYRCMKCSTQFSQEVPLSGVMKSVLTCPTCNSTLVIQMDEVPLPSHQDLKSEKLQVPAENAPATTMNSSPSQSSIGHSGLGAVSDSGVTTVTGGGDRLQVKTMVNYSEVQEPPSCSAASLDPYADSPNNTGNAVKRWDSDIEIISNPSQSSIEVLDEQTRLQGSSTPARKRSSEEKQIVTVVVPTPQPPVAEANNHALSLAGLTESSSSGSFTDSICTTYEIHSSSLPKQGAMFPRVEEVDAVNDVKDSLDKNINGGMDSKPDEMVNKISENTELEDDSPNSLFKMNEKAINPQANYAILLEGLLQNVGSKLAPKTPDKLLEAQENKEMGLRSDLVKYSYTDYSVVDHRVKLYLYLELFQQKSEELVFLVRAHVVYRTLNSSYPGHFVVSTKNVYILQVTGEEGEDPASWLHKVECISVEKMKEIYPLLWHQGIGIEMMSKGEEICNIFLVLQDQDYTGNFFTFLSGLSLPKQCNVRYKVKDEYLLSNLLTCSLSGDDVDMNVISCTIVSSCIVQRNEDCQHLSMAALVVTSTDFVLTDNLEWLFTKPSNAKKASHVQRMSNLIEVGMEGFCEIVFSFLDEVAGTDESWTLNFKTVSSLQSVVSAIKTPWEQLFSVPLTIINKET